MARPREFNTEELLDKASLAFLQDGLQLTSMRHLEDLTGVKQVSLYNAFGSKEGLFLAAFDRYTAQMEKAQHHFLDDRGLDGDGGNAIDAAAVNTTRCSSPSGNSCIASTLRATSTAISTGGTS